MGDEENWDHMIDEVNFKGRDPRYSENPFDKLKPFKINYNSPYAPDDIEHPNDEGVKEFYLGKD